LASANTITALDRHAPVTRQYGGAFMSDAIPNHQPHSSYSGRPTSADRRAAPRDHHRVRSPRASGISARLVGVPSGPQRDILIVEDDVDTADTLQQMLSDEGHTVDLARGGAECLHALRRGRYRLLLLDLMMPGVDGMHVLHALRAQPHLRPRAVVILSACATSSDVRSALAAGADDYLTKPVERHNLLLRIELWIRRTGAVETLPSTGLRIHSLGRFCVERDGNLLLNSACRARKAMTLFKYLLTQHARAVPTGEILSLLWPDTAEDAAATDLRSLLHQLRLALGLSTCGETRLVHTGATLALHLSPRDWWDVAEFGAMQSEGARRVRINDAEGAIAAYYAAVSLYAGDYLAEDAYTDWTADRREQLRVDWLHALGTLATLYQASGQHAEQETVLRTLLHADPYREEGQRALMTLLAEQGRGAEALVLYRRLQQRLRAEFDAHPDPKTAMLALHIGRRAAETVPAL
jgi:two-component SAPR family response regulator